MFDDMCDREGFKTAPQVAKYKQLLVEDITKMSKAECEKYSKQSYNLVKGKLTAKIKKQLGIE